ncbi:MAG: RnfABCDGE type electron transport complex subunit B [Rhodoferax sp.]|nr:RnfABCDGE type electron transport complex subunit B [Rhodoferax sp.]
MQNLTDRILAALPQTQCTRCGFQDCRAYAEAIASRSEPINQCPPGGQEGVERLARITLQVAPPLNTAFGQEAPRSVALIDESWCIGCTLCIKACPTDAIVGANKLMHTVMEAYCTGCGLCLPPCPVDCIEMVTVSGTATGWSAWSPEQADQARSRYEFAKQRRMMDDPSGSTGVDVESILPGPGVAPVPQRTEAPDTNKRQQAAQAALTRARARRAPAPHKAEPTP